MYLVGEVVGVLPTDLNLYFSFSCTQFWQVLEDQSSGLMTWVLVLKMHQLCILNQSLNIFGLLSLQIKLGIGIECAEGPC